MPNIPQISRPQQSILQTREGGNTTPSGTEWFSKPFHRHPASTLVTLSLVADQNGTLDVQWLKLGGDALVDGDWATYNTAAEQVNVTAGDLARMTLQGAPPILRLVYVPVAGATVSVCDGAQSGGGYS